MSEAVLFYFILFLEPLLSHLYCGKKVICFLDVIYLSQNIKSINECDSQVCDSLK